MPWIGDMHFTLSPDGEKMSQDEIEAAASAWRSAAEKRRREHDTAKAALEGSPFVAVPIDQLASIYKRFLRLTRIGQGTIEEWEARSEAECAVRRAVFQQSDFGAVFAGQWLPRELREEVRNLVHGKRYDYAFDHHVSAYHRNRMDRLIHARPHSP